MKLKTIKIINDNDLQKIIEGAKKEGKKLKEIRHTKNGKYAVIIDDEPTELELLQQENKLLKAQNKAMQDKTDFHEDVLAELILKVHS